MADNIQLSVPTVKDAVELMRNMREADRRELHEMGFEGVLAPILESIELSDPEFLFTARSPEGSLLCIAGCNIYGQPWLLGTDLFPHYKKSSVKMAREWIKKVLIKYPYLTNRIDYRNVYGVKWLKAVGFTFDDIIDYPFHKFEMRQNVSQNSTGCAHL